MNRGLRKPLTSLRMWSASSELGWAAEKYKEILLNVTDVKLLVFVFLRSVSIQNQLQIKKLNNMLVLKNFNNDI